MEGLFVHKERFVLSRAIWRFLYRLAQLLFFDVVGSNGHLRRSFCTFFLGVGGEGVTETLRENFKVEEWNPGAWG